MHAPAVLSLQDYVRTLEAPHPMQVNRQGINQGNHMPQEVLNGLWHHGHLPFTVQSYLQEVLHADGLMNILLAHSPATTTCSDACQQQHQFRGE